MKIGDWVRRKGVGRRTKWHLVESIVSDDAITRCGRRLVPMTVDGYELAVSEVMPLTRLIGQPQLCKSGCDRPEHPSPLREDDGSTAPIDAVDVP